MAALLFNAGEVLEVLVDREDYDCYVGALASGADPWVVDTYQAVLVLLPSSRALGGIFVNTRLCLIAEIVFLGRYVCGLSGVNYTLAGSSCFCSFKRNVRDF